MAIGPAVYDSDATKIVLAFNGNTTDLTNIDFQRAMKRVIHRVQSSMSALRPYVTVGVQDETFQWQKRTPHRNPTKRTSAIPDTPAVKQEFDSRGINVDMFDDGAFLVEAVVSGAEISLEMSILESMEAGFERLFDKVALSAMLMPVRQQTSTDWKQGDKASSEVALDVTKYVGGNLKAGSLAVPELETYIEIRKQFKNRNANPDGNLCGLLTPGMEAIISNTEEYKNRDFIYAAKGEQMGGPFVWKKIKWIPIQDDVNIGAAYASSYVGRASASENKKLALLTSQATVSSVAQYDLSSSNHEVVPIWKKENIKVNYRPKASKAKILNRPDKVDTPQLFMSKALGSTRLEDERHFNLVVPV